MRKLIVAILFFVSPFLLQAQKSASIRGAVYDSVAKKTLSYATVSLVNAKDSSLVSFVRADSTGKFYFNQLAKGKYTLSASYVGFVPLWLTVTVKENEALQLGYVNLTNLSDASSVTVYAKRPPVVINNDTIEFNTENFKTQPNAVVEDLLKKMPGVTVDDDGTIKVNGQTVNKVLVNGKEFFTGDIKMATKNLDADAIDKIQVFDKKSDQSEFTGVDDGNTTKTINLKLKKDRLKSVFGKVAGGTNFSDRFETQANVNRFSNEQQLSFIGMGNNTNKQGFSIGDVLNFTGELSKAMKNGGGSIRISSGGSGPDNAGLPTTGMGQNQQGIANTYAGGLNFNDTWNKKTDFNGSATGSNIHLNTDKDVNRQYNLTGNNYNYASTTNSVSDIKQQKLNFGIDHKIDSFNSIKITPSITWQQQSNSSTSNYSSVYTNGTKLNDGYTNSSSASTGLNIDNTILYRHRFEKKGRTISLNFSNTYNHSTKDGLQGSRYTDYTIAIPKDSLIKQNSFIDAITRNVGGNVTYTEPIGKRSLLELSSFINTNIGESDKKTYDYNATTGKYDLLNKYLSNEYKNNYSYTGGSINFRSNQKKYNYTLGSSIQSATLNSINQTTDNTIQRSFTDVLPNASLQYKFSNYKNIRLDYSTSTQQPSTTQLQPVVNNSDPLNISTGNPDLKRAYSQSVNINYFAADPVTRKNFFVFASAGITANSIVNSVFTQSNGVRTTMPVNADGTSFFFANANYGMPVKALKSRFDISAGYNYSHSVSFMNGVQNNIDNASISPSLNWGFSIDNVIDIQANARLSFTNAKYSLQPTLNSNYLTERYGIDMLNYLPLGLTLNNTLNYTINTGRADGYNTSIPIWNASLAKSFLKNKRAEIKFSVTDILNQNQGTSRSSNQDYIEDSKYNVLQRYYMISFTFALHKSGNQQGAGGPPPPMIRVFNN